MRAKPGLEFGHFQDLVRINKSLLFTKAERDLGLWPKGAGENASRRVRSDSCRCAHRFDDWSEEVSSRKTETEPRRACRREIPLGFAAPGHTVPYGTVLSRDTFPGTSCLATIGCPYGTGWQTFRNSIEPVVSATWDEIKFLNTGTYFLVVPPGRRVKRCKMSKLQSKARRLTYCRRAVPAFSRGRRERVR